MSTTWEGQQYSQSQSVSSCEFCRIIANEAPATIVYQDDEVIVIRNRLKWVPVMLLVIPKKHMSQKEMWESPIIGKVASVAVQMGGTHCPGGYRLVSNFGHQAMQSQNHGHLHVLGGGHLGPYV